ncbi:MAG: glutaredoxin family protein [Chloroflexia bacterium]
MLVTVYTKPGCHLCDEVLLLVDKMMLRYEIELTEVNIIEDMAVYEQFKYVIPVVECTDVEVGRLAVPIGEADLTAYFEKARRALRSAGEPAERGNALGRVVKWLGKR